MIRINQNENKVLQALFLSAKGNGHDFGYTDDVSKMTDFTPHQAAGYIAQLCKKDIIVDVADPDFSDYMFVWPDHFEIDDHYETFLSKNGIYTKTPSAIKMSKPNSFWSDAQWREAHK